MRTPLYALIAALFFSGCTHYHATPASSTSRPADRIEEPEPEPVESLELDVGRPSGGQLLLQTNRPAYVAIFEIIPNRGVTLIYPAAAHQQNMMLSGLTWVPLWWSPKRVTFTSDRYIYAVASEEPLQLSGETFVGGYFHRVLGPAIYRAERPYATMRAISRAVVPDVAAEQWAEDVHVVTPTYLTDTYRTVRIHCPGGRVFDVPEDMVARIWCPTRTRVVIIDASRPRSRDYPVGRPVRPDSVYGRGRWKFEPRRPRGPVARVVDPTGRDRDDRDNRGGRGRDARDERDDRDDRDDKPETKRGGRIKDLINDAKKEEYEREKQEKERQRREAEDARRREAEERKAERDERKDERRDEREARKDERDERKDERKEERADERDARKDEREERKDERKEEPKQQGQPREERDEKRDEKRDESRDDKADDNKRRGSIKDMIKEQKEKKEKKDKP
jgi:hypothetical protein